MIGLLCMVVLVTAVYEVLIVAIVMAGARLRETADHGLEDPELDVGERRLPAPAPPPVAASRVTVPLRASDRERDAAAALVADAMGEGRLDLDEGVDRLDAVYRARDRATLDRLVADLPHRSQPRSRKARVEVEDVLGPVALVSVAAAAMAQVVAGAWVLWPVAVVFLLPLACRRRS